MAIRFSTISLLALALVSCDKVKDIANKASSAVQHEITAKTAGAASSVVDEHLQKLVDESPEGVIFRKDLPFPQRLEVRTTSSAEMSVRFFHQSELGKTASTLEGTELTVIKLERAGDQVRFTMEQSSFSIPSVEDPKAGPTKIDNPLEVAKPPTSPVFFRKSGNGWVGEKQGDFHSALLSQQLAPALEDLLVENTLAPRRLWFAKRRFKPGDELDVTGESVSMLVAGQAKGSFHLKFEAIEPVNGHPCGRFSVTGDYSRKQFPDLRGNLNDQNVSIESGKLWLSLLYPIVLKEELDTIQSFKSGGNGGLSGRGQGSAKVSTNREWKAIAP